MQNVEKPRAGGLLVASRALLWLVAALLAAGGAILVMVGISGSGDTAPALFIVPGAAALLIAVVLALVGWTLRSPDAS